MELTVHIATHRHWASHLRTFGTQSLNMNLTNGFDQDTRRSETDKLILSGLNGLTWTLFLLGSSKETLLNTAGIFNRPHTDKSAIFGRGSPLLCQSIMSTNKDANSEHCHVYVENQV